VKPVLSRRTDPGVVSMVDPLAWKVTLLTFLAFGLT